MHPYKVFISMDGTTDFIVILKTSDIMKTQSESEIGSACLGKGRLNVIKM